MRWLHTQHRPALVYARSLVPDMIGRLLCWKLQNALATEDGGSSIGPFFVLLVC